MGFHPKRVRRVPRQHGDGTQSDSLIPGHRSAPNRESDAPKPGVRGAPDAPPDGREIRGRVSAGGRQQGLPIEADLSLLADRRGIKSLEAAAAKAEPDQ